MGALKAGAGKRAVGIRDRVMAHLTTVGEIRDPSGMASAALARAVGYPGSSVAFAQLLSGMERSGLIEREIQGKRTYQIAAAGSARPLMGDGSRTRRPAAGREPEPAIPPAARGGVRAEGGSARVAGGSGDVRGQGGSGDVRGEAGSYAPGFDYDELARRLLAQVLRGAAVASAGERYPVSPAATAEPEPAAGHRRLRAVVARLEGELAAVRVAQRRLTAENARLREQIKQAEQSLAAIQERAGQVPSSGLASPEAALLLERLLSPPRETLGRGRRADAS